MVESGTEIFRIAREEDLEDVVEAVVARIQVGDKIALEGALGAGKTAFVRRFLKKLGVRDRVISPTYALMLEYELEEFRVIHIDAYRLQPSDTNLGESSCRELPWDVESFKEAVVFVEWPEFSGIPPDAFKHFIRFELEAANSTARTIRWHSTS